MASPFRGGQFARVDQGVDWQEGSPYRSVGAGVVTRVAPRSFAGGTGDAVYITLDHPVTVNGRTYRQVYYAEQSPLVHLGQRVAAGQPVMRGGGAELGFASGNAPAAALVGGLGRGTQQTTPGQDFLAFTRGGGSSAGVAPPSPQVGLLSREIAQWNAQHPRQTIDPAAAFAVARQEGLSGAIGDGGHAFGPFQLNNAGGVLTGKFSGLTPQQINAWAWSPAGINYALTHIASVAGGQRGAQAVTSIVSRFERPANIPGETQRALAALGQPVPAPSVAGSTVQPGGPVPAGGLTAAHNAAQNAAALKLLSGLLSSTAKVPVVNPGFAPLTLPTAPAAAPPLPTLNLAFQGNYGRPLLAFSSGVCCNACQHDRHGAVRRARTEWDVSDDLANGTQPLLRRCPGVQRPLDQFDRWWRSATVDPVAQGLPGARYVTAVLTIGTFDLGHRGHLRLLARAATLGDLHVGVNTDRFVQSYKGRACVQGFDERVAFLNELPFVKHVWANNDAGRTLIESIKPDLLVVGSDWHAKNYLDQIGCGQDLLDAWGVGLVYLPRTPGVSSTLMRKVVQ